jgi:arylsulfatase A-like enzyme
MRLPDEKFAPAPAPAAPSGALGPRVALADACRRPAAFWPCFWMGVVLVASKAVYLGVPEFSGPGLVEYARDVAVIARADVLFVVVLGLVFQAALAALATRPRLRRSAWALLVFLGCVAVTYAVVSVQVFAYMRSPLTYPLLYLAGDITNMRSSVGAFATPMLLTALVLTPLVYLALTIASARWLAAQRTRRARMFQALGASVLVGYGAWAAQAAGSMWSDRDDRRICDNPHWVLVSSCITEFLGGHSVQFAEDFPPEYLGDFRTVAERAQWDPPAALRFAPAPRNVIIVVLESVATHYLSLYGSKYATTPRLEQEAKHALVFDNFYCHVGNTANSLFALLLSTYPGLSWREYTVEFPGLPGTTLAQVLRERGYRTLYVTAGDNDYANQGRFVANRGFDRAIDFRSLGCGPRLFSWGVEDRCLVDGMLRWIDEDRTRPFFLFAWTIQTHHPYELSPGQEKIDFFGDDPPDDAYDLDLYLNVLHEEDAQLGRLFDALRERGLAEDTVVLITGDHGETFNEPHPGFGHTGRIYQEDVNVPLILWNPRMPGAGTRPATIGAHVDLNPTIADLLGIAPPGPWQGRSLFDPDHPPRAYSYGAHDDYILGVREQHWKYMLNVTWGREELYDLGRDPSEQSNLAGAEPERCRALRQRLAAWVDYQGRHMKRLEQSK